MTMKIMIDESSLKTIKMVMVMVIVIMMMSSDLIADDYEDCDRGSDVDVV